MKKNETGFSKTKLRSSYLTLVVSVSLVLFLLGILGLVLINAKGLSDYFRESLSFWVMLDDNAKEADIRLLQKDLDAKTYVPGHGPVAGREAIYEQRELMVLMRDEARKCFDNGMSYKDAAQKMDLGRYKELNPPAFLMPNVVRCYCDFRGKEPASPLPSDVNFLEMIAEIARLVKVPE